MRQYIRLHYGRQRINLIELQHRNLSSGRFVLDEMNKRHEQTSLKDVKKTSKESTSFSSIIQNLKNKKLKQQSPANLSFDSNGVDSDSARFDLKSSRIGNNASKLPTPTFLSIMERLQNKISDNSNSYNESSSSSDRPQTPASPIFKNPFPRINVARNPVSGELPAMNIRQAAQLAEETSSVDGKRDDLFSQHSAVSDSDVRPVQQAVLESLASTLSTGKSTLDAVNSDEIPDISPNEMRYERKLLHLEIKKEEYAEKVGLALTSLKWSPKSTPQKSTSSSRSTSSPRPSTLHHWQPEVLYRPRTDGAVDSNSDTSRSSISYRDRISISTNSSNRNNNSNSSNSFSNKSVGVASSSQRTVVKEVTISSAGLTLRDLASKLSMKIADLEKKLTELGEHVQGWKETDRGEHHIDADIAELVVLELGLAVLKKDLAAVDPAANANRHKGQTLQSRAPLVCIMGHVDHGKTTLLDTLRHASMAASEAGGITQKLSAFSVPTGGRSVLFLDTPGHAAFSSMRAHGVEATDLAVLVIALDDGVRPQTVEALKTAQKAGCPIVIALNKIDKISNTADREKARSKCLTQLTEFGIVAEDFGGDVPVVEVAGKTGLGLDTLVETLLFQADMLELKSAFDGPAEAVVLEASVEKGRGIVVDVLVKWGQMNVGDDVVVGTTFGRIKAMTDDKGKAIKVAHPSTAVRLLGLRSLPLSGSEMLGVESEARARQIAERRERVLELKQAMQTANVVAAKASNEAEEKPNQTSVVSGGAATIPTLNVLLKADGVGTLDALRKLVEGLNSRTTDVTVNIIGTSVGDVTKSDVEFADTASGALILGFNIGVADASTRTIAKEQDVRIVRDTVIYRLEDELMASMTALMPKQRLLHPEGTAKVLKVFQFTDKNATVVAGLSVLTGYLRAGKNMVYQVKRQGATVHSGELEEASLKRFKDPVTEVVHGYECGLSIEKFRDYQEGDDVECFRVEWKTKELSVDAVRTSAMPYR